MFGSIRHQLTLIICSLIVLTLTSALMISYYLVAADYEEKMQQINSVMAESLGSNIAQFMQNTYNITEIMAKSSNMTTIDVQREGQLLVDAAIHYPFFQVLAVHKLNGDQIARSSGQLANRAERWWFKKFMAEKKPFITKTYYSVNNDSAITTIVQGVYSQGNLAGVFMADIEVQKLQEMVDGYNSGAGSYAYLLDGDGAVIAHPDRKQVAEIYNYKTMKKILLVRDANGKGIRDDKDNEITVEIDFPVAPSLQEIITKVMNGETGVGEYIDLNEDQYICAYRTILLPGRSDPWSLIVVQKKSAALAFIYDVTIKNILVGMFVLTLSALLTFWFSRRITNPLIDIVHATNQIKNGDLTVRLTIKSANEIGMLAMNFNQMVAELQHHHDGLEGLVEARTGELGAANQELIAMNEEIIAMNDTLEDTNQRLQDENGVRRQMEEKVLVRERQYRAITSLLTHPVDESAGLLKSILHDALQLVYSLDGYIGLYDESGKMFFIHHVMGNAVPQFRLMGPMLVKSGLQEAVYTTGEILVVDDYQQDPRRTKEKQLERVASLIMLPLKQEGQVKGMLCACWADVVHHISAEDVAILSQFCDLASVALERTNSQKKIRHMAFYDTLTGLPNRESLNEHLAEEMKRAHAGEGAGVIMFIDIDDLKSVNDNFGHSFGDSVIIAAGKHIVAAVGEQGFVAHSGGDEFIIVLPGAYSREEVALFADAILDAICQEYEVSIEHLHMSASIGVVIYPDDGDSGEDLLKKADSAMYAAKKGGRNCWRFYEPIFLEEAYEKMMLTNSLRRALERGELSLHYQPQMTVEGDAVIGFEALLRWNSFEHGCVSPVRFIPLAEESGLIVPIGQWVLREACRFARRLADMGKGTIHVAVNISPRQLLSDDFVHIVRRSIADAEIAPAQLEIEITESALIESMEDSISKLGQLRESGLMISLDDFGTGYSSLTYLRSLPVGVLKIDKSFIDNITSDKIQLQMVGSIIDLAHTLGLTVVAEGVETEDQLTLLKLCGCEHIQGYIFSRPMPEEEAIKFLT